MSCGYPYNSMA